MRSEIAAARRRHPSGRWPAPADRLRSRVAQSLDLHGVAHADVAAAVLEARGRSGLGPEGFADHLAVDADVLRRAESGALGYRHLPGALRRVVR